MSGRIKGHAGETFSFLSLSIGEASTEFPVLWQTVEDAFPDLNTLERARVVSLVADTCRSCHEHDSSCQCWNDD
jgi:hypothetical protein